MKSSPYTHALSLLGNKANRPDAVKRLGGKATTARKLVDGSVAVRYHDTDILTFRPNGQTVITSGGFRSATTKAKINEYLPPGFPRVWQSESEWHLAGQTFMDGDTLTRAGKLGRKAGRSTESKRIADLTKRINTFARLCGDAVPLPMPGPGDCFMCALERDGKYDAAVGHLVEHMREGYVVPSLVWRALCAVGYDPARNGPVFAAIFGGGGYMTGSAREWTVRAVRRYLKARFGLAGGCFGRLSGGIHGEAKHAGAKPSVV